MQMLLLEPFPFVPWPQALGVSLGGSRAPLSSPLSCWLAVIRSCSCTTSRGWRPPEPQGPLLEKEMLPMVAHSPLNHPSF